MDLFIDLPRVANSTGNLLAQDRGVSLPEAKDQFLDRLDTNMERVGNLLVRKGSLTVDGIYVGS